MKKIICLFLAVLLLALNSGVFAKDDFAESAMEEAGVKQACCSHDATTETTRYIQTACCRYTGYTTRTCDACGKVMETSVSNGYNKGHMRPYYYEYNIIDEQDSRCLFCSACGKMLSYTFL